MTKLEEIARAMWCSGHKLPDEAWILVKNSGAAEPWFRQARAAIEAMREPSDAMKDRGSNLVPDQPCDDEAVCAGEIYQAMIDAILNEKPECMEMVTDPAGCSFCGTVTEKVRFLIAGPDVAICDACAAMIAEFIAKADAELAVMPLSPA